MEARYADAGVPAEVATFFDDVSARLAEAQLVISRAGASSLADICVVGRPSILIPLTSSASDEQAANARGLAEAGAAYVMDERELTALELARHIHRVLEDGPMASRMAAAALDHGKPEATETLVLLVEELAIGRDPSGEGESA